MRSLPRARWLILVAGCLALPVFYVSYKTFALQTHFLVGTGGTHIGLQPSTILEHLGQAARSLLAFNSGPDYLVGASVTSAWRLAWFCALLFALAWIGAIAFGSFNALVAKDADVPSPWLHLRLPLLLLILAAFLLAPALITIRLEQRWLLGPFVIGLLVVAWAAGVPSARGRRHSVAAVLAIVLAFMSVTVDTLVMRFYDRLFFVSSARFADLVKRDIVDPNPGVAGDLALLASADHCGWTLAEGGFFRIYGGKARSVRCFATLDEARRAGLPAGTTIYGAEGPQRLVELKQPPILMTAAAAAPENLRFDFIEKFAQGKISDTAHVATPTGQGALLLSWDTDGGARQTLTLLSGFAYRFDDIAIKAGDELHFAVGMIHPASQPARAIVRVQVSGRTAEVIYSEDLTPPAADARPSFRDVSLPLSKYAGQRISLSFAVESPGGDRTAHWIGFAAPSLTGRNLVP